MASTRKPSKKFGDLKTATKDRKYRFYAKPENGGLSKSQVSARYNAGSLGSQKAVRGHAHTPESPKAFAKAVAKNPKKYEGSGYRPRQPIALTPQQRNDLETQLVRRIGLLLGKSPRGYRQEFVQDNVVRMTSEQLIAGIGASEEDLREWASPQPGRGESPIMGPFYDMRAYDKKHKRNRTFTVNPWWYHGDYYSAGE